MVKPNCRKCSSRETTTLETIRPLRSQKRKITSNVDNATLSPGDEPPPTAEALATAGDDKLLKKRCLQGYQRMPVKAPAVPERQPLSPDPVYDQAGRNMTLLEITPSEVIVGNSAIQTCKFFLQKSRDLNTEMEKVLDMKLTLGPMGSLTYLTRNIATDRNLKLAMHYMLIAESHRLTVVDEEKTIYTHVQPFRPQKE